MVSLSNIEQAWDTKNKQEVSIKVSLEMYRKLFQLRSDDPKNPCDKKKVISDYKHY